MDIQQLHITISQLLYEDKGILVIDESTVTCNEQFAAVGIPQLLNMRRRYS